MRFFILGEAVWKCPTIIPAFYARKPGQKVGNPEFRVFCREIFFEKSEKQSDAGPEAWCVRQDQVWTIFATGLKLQIHIKSVKLHHKSAKTAHADTWSRFGVQNLHETRRIHQYSKQKALAHQDRVRNNSGDHERDAGHIQENTRRDREGPA